ncbi:LuxR C-terminal-related transcriptional regulator [Flagellimonas sp. HMM57]|uniref:response regulator transcription factor n=1 Tax=unclassified Flagellimonas TaxID=2644544 RepID=UPI0013D3F501|nr:MULTISPECIES: LuxR C-terminal-related transcriptional regulator [unclassified Flagellimonas]UII74847.1 LuxR C-terminal-related transcriptional regulator [Flagellimonas sp. HMM57]
MRIFVLFFILLTSYSLSGQYTFSGTVSKENAGKAIYLSLVEDYRKSSRIYLEQIIQKANIDSTGFFQFKGNNLLDSNRIYRIHFDDCLDDTNSNHYLGQCSSTESVLFVANNTDTVEFPTSFEDQSLCTITSTNSKSSMLLEVENLKEEMIFDFTNYISETNKKLNLKKWFQVLHDFGAEAKEPLVELYIYDFLSDKKNETYAYYLQDILKNDYYQDLSERLKTMYTNTGFTQQYEAEITTDVQLASFNNPKALNWMWILSILFALSLGLNLYLLVSKRKKVRTKAKILVEKLTPQEQKIVQQILQDKSNKEIAAELFVSLSTIKTHINNLYKKLEVSSRHEIVALFKK